MSKILIDATGLAALIEKHPQVEVDLMRTAVPQVATLIQQRADQQRGKLDESVRQCFVQIEKERNGQYGLPHIVKHIIRDWLAAECKELAMSTVRQMVAEQLPKALENERQKFTVTLDRLNVKEMDAINAYAKTAAEREVLALLRAGKLTITEEVTP